MKVLRFTFLMPFILLRIGVLVGQCATCEASAQSVSSVGGVYSCPQHKRDSSYLCVKAAGPANGNTHVYYVLPSSSKNAAVNIYNLQGQLVLHFDILLPRDGKLEILGNTLQPGKYVCSLVVDKYVQHTKTIVLTQ